MKVCKVAGLVGVVVAVSFAMSDVRPDISYGSKAVLFSFSGLSNLAAGAYNGGVGFKYYVTSPIAARASLIFGRAGQSVPTTLATGGEDGSISALMWGLSIGAEYHLSFERVSPYLGADIGLSMTSTENVSAINAAGGSQTTIENNAAGELGYFAGTALGLNGLAGVEFFLTKELSLGAEYHLGYSLLARPDQKITVVTGSQKNETTTEIGNNSYFGISNGGALTLSVYF
ncbi:MAG: outer membrane beta-barrel protein [Chitinispirillaceae bacterium]|nr:outer membrane beta-barrel protein [Chitinispirillaceae bacterium]